MNNENITIDNLKLPVNPIQSVSTDQTNMQTGTNIDSNMGSEKKGSKIILTDDPIAFEIKEAEEKNEEDSVSNISVEKQEERAELPKEQSGSITF